MEATIELITCVPIINGNFVGTLRIHAEAGQLQLARVATIRCGPIRSPLCGQICLVQARSLLTQHCRAIAALFVCSAATLIKPAAQTCRLR